VFLTTALTVSGAPICKKQNKTTTIGRLSILYHQLKK